MRMPRLRRLLPCALLLAACGGGGGQTSDDGSGDTTAGPTTEPAPTTGSTDPTETSGTPETCGDGALDPGETCDGSELGGKTCADVDDAFVGGELACGADCKSFDASGCELAPGATLVVLNEVLSKAATSGAYADMGDAIELYNAGGEAADLTGWKLSDDPTFPPEKTYVFPPGTTLAPGAWLVLVELDAMSGEGQFPFGITSAGEETLTLADASDELVDQLILEGADAEVSYCRVPDGTGAWQQCDQTLGATNVTASTVCGDGEIGGDEQCDGAELNGQTCEDLGLGFTGGTLGCTDACTFDASMCETESEVVINELESVLDQIEIHNAGDAAVDMSGWILTDDMVGPGYDPVADTEKLEFPDGASLGPGEFLVVTKGMNPGQHPFGLSDAGDTVSLLLPSLDAVDQVSYGAGEAAVSYCRVPDGPGGAWMAACTPTFGMPNQGP
jgi:hypothetical protein